MTNMSVIRLPAVLAPIAPTAVLPANNRIAQIRNTAPVVTRPAATPRSAEHGMLRGLKLGLLFGIPAVFLVIVALASLGGAGLGPALLCGTWTALFGGGMYLGGVFFVAAVHEPDSW